MSSATVLPAFAAHLGASSMVIAAIPAVMTVGWFLPPLFAAPHTARLARKLPFVLRWTGWERAPAVVLALVAFFLADRAPGISLALLLLMLLVMTAVGGLLMPAWMDIVGRAIPTQLRGRFFGLSSLAGTAGGFAGSFVTTWILTALPPSSAYGVCFAVSALFYGLSWAALAVVREPPGVAVPPGGDFGTHLREVTTLLQRDHNFSRFLATRVLGFTALTGTAFFTVYALRAWAAPTAAVGTFTALFMAGQMAGHVVLGWLGDRAGHRLVIAIAMAAAAVMNLVALAAPSLAVFAVTFLVYGVYNGGIQVSSLNVLLEFAPTEQARPTYVGIERTLLAPFGFGVPFVGALVVQTLGYPVLFATGAVGAALGVAALLLLVRDPRHGVALSPGRLSA